MLRTLLALLAAALLVPALALGQPSMDYQPFRPGNTPFFSCGVNQDSLFSFHVSPVSGSTNVFQFELVVRRLPHSIFGTNVGCYGGSFTDTLSSDNHFGAQMIAGPGGAFELVTSARDTFHLLTHGAIGTDWVFCRRPAIQATLVARWMGPVLNTSDSLVRISLSTGQQLVLSKQFGLVSGPALMPLVSNNRWTPHDFTLYSLPEAGYGPLPPIHSFRLFDFQPGDEFAYFSSQDNGAFPPWNFVCIVTWSQDRYLTRSMSADGDTIIYTYLHQEQEDFVGAGAPGCGNTPGSVVHPVQTRILRVPRMHNFLQVPGVESLRSSGFVTYSTGLRKNAGPFPCSDAYQWWQATQQYDSCAHMFGVTAPDVVTYRGVTATEGLGYGKPLWYKKNGLYCGNRAGFPTLLGAPALLPERAVQLYPNPATESARLQLEGTKGGLLTLTATDALGRLVWRQQTTIGPGADMALPVESWPRGVYLVRVQLPEGARTLRLVRE